MGTLILVCGLPGSGKSTLALRLRDDRKAILYCPDQWIEAILASSDDVGERDRLRDPIENLQWELAKQNLLTGHTVILENGFWGAEERDQYAMEALELAARIELVYCRVDSFEELWRRVEGRNAKLGEPTWRMTADELRGNWNCFQPPTEEEMAFYDDFSVA